MSRKEARRPGLVQLAVAGKITTAAGARGPGDEPAAVPPPQGPVSGRGGAGPGPSPPRPAVARGTGRRASTTGSSSWSRPRTATSMTATPPRSSATRGPARQPQHRPPDSAGPRPAAEAPPPAAAAPRPPPAPRRPWAPRPHRRQPVRLARHRHPPAPPRRHRRRDEHRPGPALPPRRGPARLSHPARPPRRARRPARDPLRRSPRRLRPQRRPLDPRGGAPGRAAPHPVRPGPPGPRHRLHRRALAPGQGPHRAPLGHPAGSPRRRAAPPRDHRPSRPAEAFLPTYLVDHNRRFAQPPADADAAWRRPPRDLADRLSCRYTRRVARDNTVRLGPRVVQIPRGPHGRSYAGCRVEVRECLDGRLLVDYQGRRLATAPAPAADFVLVPRRAQRLRASRRSSEAGGRHLPLGQNGPSSPIAALAALAQHLRRPPAHIPGGRPSPAANANASRQETLTT